MRRHHLPRPHCARVPLEAGTHVRFRRLPWVLQVLERRPPAQNLAELRLADALQQYGEAQPGLDQYAINKFGLALEVVPRTLAENAGLDATNIIAAMYAAHKAGHGGVGIDVGGSGTADLGVRDLLHTKREALKMAAEAAVTVLRVDQIIMSKPAGGPKAPEQPIDHD